MSGRDWWLPEEQQRIFRAVLDGFSRPGSLVSIGDEQVAAVLMLLAALLDESVTLADPLGYLSADQRRLLLATDAVSGQAHYVLLNGATSPAADFHPLLGTLESPERGSTLVLMVEDLPQSAQPKSIELILRGPGIQQERAVHVTGLHPDWLARRAAWVGAYPLGVDMVLCSVTCLVVLPRSTRVQFSKDKAWAM